MRYFVAIRHLFNAMPIAGPYETREAAEEAAHVEYDKFCRTHTKLEREFTEPGVIPEWSGLRTPFYPVPVYSMWWDYNQEGK